MVRSYQNGDFSLKNKLSVLFVALLGTVSSDIRLKRRLDIVKL